MRCGWRCSRWTCAEAALTRVVNVFGAVRPHHAYLFANRRANRMKVLVHDGIGVWPSGNQWKGLDISAGTGVIWGNTFTGDYSVPVGGIDYKSFDPRNSKLCDGSDPKDQNVAGQSGWRCQYQIGSQGQGATAVGYPAYIWSNTVNGASTGMNVTAGGNHVQARRDYFNNGSTPKPGYTQYTYPHPLQNGSAGKVLEPPRGLHVVP